MKSLEGIDGMVQMHGVFMDSGRGCIPGKVTQGVELPVIVMELLEGGELFERIADRKTFSENNIAKIFKGIVLAMDSMHQRRYVHRKCAPALLCSALRFTCHFIICHLFLVDYDVFHSTVLVVSHLA
jgi:hypothetical protein